MKKNVLKYLIVSLTLLMFSCEKDNLEPQANLEPQINQSSHDLLKSQLNPASSLDLPLVVKEQLEFTGENLNKYMNGSLQINDINVLGELTEKSLNSAYLVVSDQTGFIAFGNLMEPSSVKAGEMQKLHASKELQDTKDGIVQYAVQELKKGDNVMEITWNSGNETFKTLCFYRESGIVWDNVITGLFLMDPKPIEEETIEMDNSKILSKTSTSNWPVYWIWGGQKPRGEIGCRIKIYYTGKTVSNIDRSDWGWISIGKAVSESKTLKSSGTYGKIQYALGLCTPSGSLSFDYKGFSVSFSGLGSNIVRNGTKSLYP